MWCDRGLGASLSWVTYAISGAADWSFRTLELAARLGAMLSDVDDGPPEDPLATM